jgi:hypothetical protein
MLTMTRIIGVCVVCLLSAATGRAGTITGVATTVFPGASTGSVGPIGLTPAPNNDNETGPSPNVIPYSIFYNTFGTLEVEFEVTDSGGVTEYRITQNVVNNSRVIWRDFHFELGFGTGANFVRSGAGDGLDFDTPDRDPAPTGGAFTTLLHGDDTIDWSGASIPSIGVVAFALAIDVPDGITSFTLREFPTTAVVPEPSLAALAMSGGLALAALARRRR